MDVVPLPERKKPNFLRATKEQLDILMAAFAASDVASQLRLAALSEASGLPPKWIASWFTRQRKKVAVASRHIRTETSHEDTTTTAMSIQEITTFKMENIEPSLSENLRPSVDSKPKQKPVPSRKSTKKTTRKPAKKRTKELTAASNSSLHPPPSPLPPPFVSAPLASRSVPSLSEQHLFEAQPQPADRASPTSTFILREMVPVVYKPQTPNRNDLIHPSANTVDSQPFEATSPGLSAKCPTPVTVSNAIAPDVSIHSHSTTSQSTGQNSKVHCARTTNPGLSLVYPWQDSNPPTGSLEAGNNKNSKTIIPHKPQGPRNIPNTSALTPAQSRSTHLNDRRLRPLLPLDWNTDPTSHLYLLQQSQALSGTPHLQGNRNSKENQLRCPQLAPSASKLRSSGPRTLTPLFTTTDLETARARRPIHTITTDGPVPTLSSKWIQQHFFFQTQTGSLELSPVEENENQAQSDDQTSTFFDSTTAPLKYLDVLAPFPDESLSMDEVTSRLMDPQLVEEDPFQAAMGLVFASQLGLNWDYT